MDVFKAFVPGRGSAATWVAERAWEANLPPEKQRELQEARRKLQEQNVSVVVLTRGLDRGVWAFLRVELTHAPAQSPTCTDDTARSTLPTTCRAGWGSMELGVSAIVPKGLIF